MAAWTDSDDRNERINEKREALGLIECEECGRVVDEDKTTACHACGAVLCRDCAINVEPEDAPDYYTCPGCNEANAQQEAHHA